MFIFVCMFLFSVVVVLFCFSYYANKTIKKKKEKTRSSEVIKPIEAEIDKNAN